MSTPYHADESVTIYHGDCREILPNIETRSVGLVLTDPPYGMNLNTDYSGMTGFSGKRTGRTYAPVVGDDQPFDPAALLRFRRLVLWGANHYASRLPDSGGWVAWNKRGAGGAPNSTCFGDGELAWTNLSNSVRFVDLMWHGTARWQAEPVWHPTQKPAALMRWALDRWAKPGDLILDPYMGCGPVPRAAVDLGMRCIGIEIDERYCEIAAKRLDQGVLDFGTEASA